MDNEVIQSAWWFVYYLENDEPRFLLVKRHALSGKIERIAPKWKVEKWETKAEAAIREVSEETNIPLNYLHMKKEVWISELRMNNEKNMFKKDITYFLIEFSWNPENIQVQTEEWFLWVHKRATIQEVLSLVHYTNIRELIRKAYIDLKTNKKKQNITKDFIDKFID